MSAASYVDTAGRVRKALGPLLQREDGVRLSVYIPIRPPPDTAQNEVVQRHAIAEASKRLERLGVPPTTVERWTERLAAVLHEHGAAAPARRTLAAFSSEDGLCVLPLAHGVPYEVTAQRAFRLRPALYALQAEGAYRVLGVSANRVALYEGDASGLVPAPLGEIPQSLEGALGTEKSEKELRVRGTGPGGSAPVSYSHDTADAERILDRHRFHHALVGPVHARFAGDPTPLVLAADATHQSELRAALRLPSLVAEPLLASPDHLTAAELHARAWPLVTAARASGAHDARAAIEHARRSGKAVELLDDVVAAACAGRVRRLWVDGARTLSGRIDAKTGRALSHETGSDLLDDLVEAVLRHGGDVRVVAGEALPTLAGAAAELR